MVLNSCLPVPKIQDVSCVSRWMAEYQSVISKPESDLSIKIQGTAVRAWGKKSGSIFLKSGLGKALFILIRVIVVADLDLCLHFNLDESLERLPVVWTNRKRMLM